MIPTIRIATTTHDPATLPIPRPRTAAPPLPLRKPPKATPPGMRWSVSTSDPSLHVHSDLHAGRSTEPAPIQPSTPAPSVRSNPVQRKFVVITDPSQAKDPRILKGIRRHVMHYGSDNPSGGDAQSSSKSTVQRRFSSTSRTSRSSSKSDSKKRRKPSNGAYSSRLVITSARTMMDTSALDTLSVDTLSSDRRSTDTASLETSSIDTSSLLDADRIMDHDSISPSLQSDGVHLEDLHLTNSRPDSQMSPTSGNYGSYYSSSQNSPINVQIMRRDFMRVFDSQGLRSYFDEKASNNQLFVLSALAISAAYVDTRLGTDNNPATLELGLEISTLLQENMKRDFSRASDYTIASVAHVSLAGGINAPDSVITTHQEGLRRMVQWRGGLKHVGLNGCLARLVILTGLSSAIFRERHPHPYFVDSAAQFGAARDYTPMRLESPVCCARGSLLNVVDSQQCSAELTSLLHNLHYMCDIASHYRPDSPNNIKYELYRDTVRTTIRSFPAFDPTAHFPDHIYECCRLSALILEEAMYNRVPFSVAVRHTNLVAQLKESLAQTDLDNSWGDLEGVLIFVTHVAAAASYAPTNSTATPSEDQQWLTATAVRASFLHVFDSGDEVLRSLYKLLHIQLYCEGYPQPKTPSPGSSGIFGGLLSGF